ncbi:MAG: hypothetical protein O6761_01565, partial [Thaumarchaeota archaeon]|nr:hypothetical protein [Nitrososphaerota archaeon]
MMRLLSLSVLVMLSLTTVAYAQTLGTFSYTILPEKMLEHSEGIIQVYELSNGIMRSSTIEDLRVRSSDISVIQIIETEKDENEFITNVRIKSLKPGIATIAIISSGFSSLEFPIIVYANNNFPTQILMKFTPDNFSLDGPKRGYVAIELATTNGLPVIATQDITISLSTSKNVVTLLDKELIINKGEYYALGQFEVKNPGIVEIYATAENMETKSDSITVGEKEDLTVKLYMPIEKINTFRGSEAHIIVQLQDSSGSPVVAQ